MKIIGLTGGIGSGKSTVAKEFEQLGVAVYIADEQSKKLLSTNQEVIKSVKELLGANSYIIKDSHEIPDKKFIASQVFNNADLLKQLNAILHPAVRNDFNSFKETHKSESLIVYEAAILFESGGDSMCDEVVLVTADREERIHRVMLRDGVDKAEVLARMNNQWSESKKLERSNFVIFNDNIEYLSSEVSYLYYFMLNDSDLIFN